MSEENKVEEQKIEQVVEQKEELLPVAGPLDEPLKLFEELNTVYAESEKYSEQHKQKKTVELIKKLSENTGFYDPRISELESKILEKEKSLSETVAKLGEMETLKEEMTKRESTISDLSAELEKFKLGRNAKVYGEKTMLDSTYVDHKAEWLDLLKTNPKEATKYYDKHIESLTTTKRK